MSVPDPPADLPVMSDERLRWIRRQVVDAQMYERNGTPVASSALSIAAELLAEVDRLRAELAKFQADGWVSYDLVDGFMEATFHDGAARPAGEQ